MRRLTVLFLSLALLGLAYAGGVSPAAAAAKDRTQPTPFAFGASGFGTKVVGGDVPASAARTASRIIGCTNLGNLRRGNTITGATVPGTTLSVGAATTALRTIAEPRRDLYASVSRQTLADVTLVDTPAGKVTLRGLTALARAESRRGRLRTSTDINIGRLVLRAPGAPARDLRVPTPNRPVEVPGLVRLEVGSPVTRNDGRQARALASVLRVTLLPSNTRVIVSNARARIERGVRSGVFQGFSAGVRASAADDNVKVGRNPLLQMSCLGTRGELQEADLAGVDLPDQIEVGALGVAQRATNGRTRSTGFERAEVADVDLADGALRVEGISSRAQVTRDGTTVTRKASGDIARITANGEPQAIPAPGESLEIPGLATITPQVVKRSRNGVSVVGLRIDLVDGDLARVDLAVSDLKIRRGVTG